MKVKTFSLLFFNGARNEPGKPSDFCEINIPARYIKKFHYVQSTAQSDFDKISNSIKKLSIGANGSIIIDGKFFRERNLNPERLRFYNLTGITTAGRFKRQGDVCLFTQYYDLPPDDDGNAFLKNAFQLSSSTEDWTTLFTINDNDREQIEEMQNFIKEYAK